MLLNQPTETIKFLLENLQNPDNLNEHPWGMSGFTKEYLARHPEANELTSGRQLASALAELFLEWMPASPPRQGKRLDTRWGEYGLLSAQYFVPFLSGTVCPRSLKEAWGTIDQSILAMVARKNTGAVPEAQTYQLIANEPEAANSTLSDWHRKSIERFATFVVQREKNLDIQDTSNIETNPSKKKQSAIKTQSTPVAKIFAGLLLIVLIAGSTWAYFKAQRIIELVRLLRQDVRSAQQMELSPALMKDTEIIEQSLGNIDQHLHAFDAEVRPYLWITRSLGWLPVYGGDLENSETLLNMALALNQGVQNTYKGVAPFISLLNSPEPSQVDDFVFQIKASQPALSSALQSLQEAQALRSGISTDSLSPEIRELVEEKVDPAVSQLAQALQTATALPGLLGAGSDGPKTYMIILQNEDEIRATGGFLTAVGSVVLRDGKIINMVFESSDEVDDISKPYPPPPWQLTEYMDAEIFLLRDANWFPDFPTTAAWIEYLYAYTRAYSVNGIVAIDQYAIVEILKTTGPIQVEGYDQPIAAENIIQVMRDSKIPPQDETDPNWNRKDFIGQLAEPMLKKIMSGQGFSWSDMLKTSSKLLDEKHILLQFDEPGIAAILAMQGWDGQVVPFPGDYLMVVDSNIGFTKTNAIIEQKINLEIDLRNIDRPRKHIQIEYNNPIRSSRDCNNRSQTEDWYYPIIRCYGDYLRIYVPEDSLLTESTPHAVPAEWTVREKFIPARVDTLTDDLNGFSVFGTYFFVPSGEKLSTSFTLDTPGHIIAQGENNQYRYLLKIQKQPGTVGIPFSMRLVLPEGAKLESAPDILNIRDEILSGQFSLYKDIIIEILFSY